MFIALAFSLEGLKCLFSCTLNHAKHLADIQLPCLFQKVESNYPSTVSNGSTPVFGCQPKDPGCSFESNGRIR